MRYLEDLRFMIGLFFAIISAILLLVGWTSPPSELGFNLNLIVGSLIGGFSAIMLSLGILAQKSCPKSPNDLEGQTP